MEKRAAFQTLKLHTKKGPERDDKEYWTSSRLSSEAVRQSQLEWYFHVPCPAASAVSSVIAVICSSTTR